ncbi:circularly permutated Ras protein 1-like isoform X2 [Physella acuta]|uniref:circularly permutated Ras protein 1-like isoform X2 n=1 Tax=Physella acuta TaxID=109671 RepID=UPI0027DD248F|nr:circularly permutated Ras protein 1-like isoform X2 [Physella acuta]
MEFGAAYILVEEEEDSTEDEDSDDDTRMFFAAMDTQEVHNDETSGFECEIMEFEDEPVEEDEADPKDGKINVNKINIKMAKLLEPADAHVVNTDLVYCKNKECEALVSHIDERKDENKIFFWECKFCGKTKNEVTQQQVIKGNDILYVEGPEKIPDLTREAEVIKVILLVDISASMSQRMKAKNTKDKILLKVLNQEKPFEDHIETVEITWLQAVKIAVIKQIEKLKTEKPKWQVGLVTFNDKVTIYSDGSGPSKLKEFSGAELENGKELQTKGEEFRSLKSISESADDLVKIVLELKEQGRTAMGPALMLATGMGGDVKGSKIIICTDGATNVGCGRLEDTTTDIIEIFYKEAKKECKELGLSTSVMSIDSCQLDTLQPLCHETGGTIAFIKPDKLDEPISEELNQATIATDVEITYVVHSDMFVKQVGERTKASKYFYKVGNIHKNSSLVFTLGKRKKEENKTQANPGTQQINSGTSNQQTNTAPNDNKPNAPASKGQGEQSPGIPDKKPSNVDNNVQPPVMPPAPTTNGDHSISSQPDNKEYPLQVQITYTDMRGCRGERVWTSLRKVTTSREVALKSSDPEVMVKTNLTDFSKQLIEASNKRSKDLRETKKKIKNSVKDLVKLFSKDQRLADFDNILNKIGDDKLDDAIVTQLHNFIKSS